MSDDFKQRIMASLDKFYIKNDPTYKPKPKKKKKKKDPDAVPTEHWEQVQVVNYLRKNGYIFTAVPNGGLRDKIAGARLRSEGVQPGVPDLLIFGPVQIAIEMKRSKGGRVSEEQKEWLSALSELGWTCKVCKGHKEAIEFLEGVQNVKA